MAKRSWAFEWLAVAAVLLLLFPPCLAVYPQSRAAERDPSALATARHGPGLEANRGSAKDSRSAAPKLQFTAGDHILGFAPDGFYAATGSHALHAEFVEAQPVAPQPETGSEDAAAARSQPARATPLQEVSYSDLWDGITLTYQATPGAIARNTYTLAPGADPAGIRLRYNVPAQIEPDGSLSLAFETGEMVESAPVAWQEIDGRRVPVEVAIQLTAGPGTPAASSVVGFDLGRYDPARTLTIGQSLLWNTFLGGSDNDFGQAIAVDGNGRVYVTGFSDGTWGSPLRPFSGDRNAFVAELAQHGAPIWNTFLGGQWDEGWGIALGSGSQIYVIGTSLKTWGSPLRAHSDGGDDAFVARLDSDGALRWHTFLGGLESEHGDGIAVDGNGQVYVTGFSCGTWGSPLRAFSGQCDAFVSRLDEDGALTWNTFLGGPNNDFGYDIAVDGSDHIYIVGQSVGTWGSPLRPFAGERDAFVARLEQDGALTWNTFLGGSSNDEAHGIAVDGSGHVYTSGWSQGAWGSPLRPFSGGADAFVARLGADGVLTWHTFLGGAGYDWGYGIAVDGSGRVYLSGDANATWGSPLRPFSGGDDTFVARLDADGTLTWNTFLGGSGGDYGPAIVLDGRGCLYVAGRSSEAWGSPLQSYSGGVDAFVARLAQTEPPDSYEVDDACSEARAIGTDGSVQAHTFHYEGDEDWVKFDAQAHKTYVIEVNNVGDHVDAVVMIHDVCNAPPLAIEENAFGPTARLAWNSPAAGEYYVGLVQNDPSLYGPGTNYDLSVALDLEKPSAPRDIRVDPDDGTLRVQWSRSASPDVVGYGVRWGTASGGPYSFKSVDGADNTFHQISGLINHRPYYIVITSFDFSGNESLFSIEVGGIPQPNVDTTRPSLTVTRPTAGDLYTTTASLLTVGGTATDPGHNLSRVQVRNAANNAEGWAYNLEGGSAAFQVASIPLALGENQIQLTVYDAAENTGTGALTIRRITGLKGAAVIVGGRNNSSSLQANINNGTNRAYRVFRAAGFGAEDIYYLSPSPQDADGDGLDDRTAETTPDNVHAALQWAAGRVGAGIPFYLYMFDHGGIESFCAEGCTVSGRIGSEVLDGWLDELESTSGCDQVNVIIEACHSGSFIDRLEGVAQSLSQDGRVIIASTGRTNNAYASAQGAYFSDAFFSAVAESSNLLTCFSQAKAAVDAAGVPQTPWMDDNGDGLYTPNVDGAYADDRYVASYFGTMLPEVTSASVELADGTGTITAWVARGDEPITTVWAAVYAPSFQAPTETTLELGVPLIELQLDPEQPGRYSAFYNNFGEEGSYRVVVYVQDRAGNQATPRVVRTGVAQESIFLPLVVRNAQ